MRKLTSTQINRKLAHLTKKELLMQHYRNRHRMSLLQQMNDTQARQIEALETSNALLQSIVATYDEMKPIYDAVMAQHDDDELIEIDMPSIH